MLPVKVDGSRESGGALFGLKSKISPRGVVITADDNARYDEARKLWNGDIDKKPLAVVEVGGPSDIRACIMWCKDQNIPFTMRGGGHSIPGCSVQNNAIVIDCQRMKNIQIDVNTKTARAESGCLLRDLDWETSLHNLAVPAGTVSHTGIAGLTLGGGWGWLSRAYGLTIDSVTQIEGYLANGDFVVCNKTEHPDLFWAARGAGQNLLAVTAFTYQCKEVPSVYRGTLVVPFKNAEKFLNLVLNSVNDAPNELSVNSYLGHYPEPSAMMSFCYVKLPETTHLTEQKCMEILSTLRKTTETDLSGSSEGFEHTPYIHMQSGADTVVPHGRGYYLKSGMVKMNPELVATLVEGYRSVPTDNGCFIGITHLGGKINEFSLNSAAWGNRNTSHTLEIITSWNDSAHRDKLYNWTRGLFQKSKDSIEGVYSNFIGSEEDLKNGSWGVHTKRLQRIKSVYDPSNLFKGSTPLLPDSSGIEASSIFNEESKEKGLNWANTDLLQWEGVRKPQRYNLAEGKGNVEEQFEEDFDLQTVDCSLILTDFEKFSQTLGTAMHTIGFCVLTNTGIPYETHESARRETEKIFSIPLDRKLCFSASRPSNSSVNQGYFGHKQTSGVHPDLVEGWVFARRSFPNLPLDADGSLEKRDVGLWPEELTEQQDFFEDYVRVHEKLVKPLTTAVLKYLGKECLTEEFSKKLDNPQCAVRLNYYPPVTSTDRKTGAGRLLGHEDVTLFTLLPAPVSEGLQVLHTNGKWIRVKAPPGSIILNTGDYMQRITNDVMPSTTHRVAQPVELSSSPRITTPLNVYLWETTVLEPIVENKDGRESYPPVDALHFHTSITEKYYGKGYKKA